PPAPQRRGAAAGAGTPRPVRRDQLPAPAAAAPRAHAPRPAALRHAQAAAHRYRPARPDSGEKGEGSGRAGSSRPAHVLTPFFPAVSPERYTYGPSVAASDRRVDTCLNSAAAEPRHEHWETGRSHRENSSRRFLGSSALLTVFGSGEVERHRSRPLVSPPGSTSGKRKRVSRGRTRAGTLGRRRGAAAAPAPQPEAPGSAKVTCVGKQLLPPQGKAESIRPCEKLVPPAGARDVKADGGSVRNPPASGPPACPLALGRKEEKKGKFPAPPPNHCASPSPFLSLPGA
uniref:Death effector domain containing 2 n=1 Tax=Apteryx owenii TaxID=8824 RepID=A0A8B9P143_APTOW